MRRVCVFLGSNHGHREAYTSAARATGRALVRRGLGLVYGGGNVGLMGELADAVLAAGGEAIGVIPEALKRREVAHTGLTELRVVATMHERKAMMGDLADGFITLPGGLGTLEELFEVVTWAQLGIHQKPVGLLDVDGWFDRLEAFLDQLVGEGFVAPGHRGMFLRAEDPDELLDALARYRHARVTRWAGRDDL